ncbi:hypothetical protein [Solibacillus sp. CAU 1738]
MLVDLLKQCGQTMEAIQYLADRFSKQKAAANGTLLMKTKVLVEKSE